MINLTLILIINYFIIHLLSRIKCQILIIVFILKIIKILNIVKVLIANIVNIVKRVLIIIITYKNKEK